MTIDDLGVAPANPSKFSVTLSEGREDQQAQVVDKLIGSVEESADRSNHETGQKLNVVA